MIIDDMIGYFSPERKLSRIKARRVISRIDKRSTRKYDGATKGRRGDGWHTTGSSPAAEIAQALPTLRSRSRDLVRNNPYAARGVQVIPHNVVGKGIRLAVDSKSDTQEKAIKTLWKEWAESTECDYDGIHDIYGLQQLALRTVVESGEVLLRRRRTRSGALSLKVQVLEGDFLASDQILSKDLPKGHSISQGIEFDSKGKRVAYHLYETHPGNTGINASNVFISSKTIRVPASEIKHIFRVDRPGQIRGVPWLSAVMLRLRDFDDYEQAQLMRQKLAASYMAFIKDIEVPDEDDEEEMELLKQFEPGAIEFLPPGKDIVLSSPPEVSENYAEYTRVMLQAVATGLGVSYEALTGNLKDINFSSSRMGWLEFQRNIEVWRVSLMKNGVNDPIWGWFEEAISLEGVSTEGVKHQWISPRREMIDPTKEIPALVKAVEAKFKTIAEVAMENGKHPEDHFEDLKAEQEILDKMGLTKETEVSNNSKATSVKQTNQSK